MKKEVTFKFIEWLYKFGEIKVLGTDVDNILIPLSMFELICGKTILEKNKM
ncbi:MAG TPA: hypothetical protein PLR26_05165 [Bacilli bacterium]|nr:hypothetical protein [Bacilli bacterium]